MQSPFTRIFILLMCCGLLYYWGTQSNWRTDEHLKKRSPGVTPSPGGTRSPRGTQSSWRSYWGTTIPRSPWVTPSPYGTRSPKADPEPESRAPGTPPWRSYWGTANSRSPWVTPSPGPYRSRSPYGVSQPSPWDRNEAGSYWSRSLDWELRYSPTPSPGPKRTSEQIGPPPNWQEDSVCMEGEWQCRTGEQCIGSYDVCNHHSNCIDNTDEWACDGENMCTISSESDAVPFPCEHTLCNIPEIPVCDPNQQFEYKVKINELFQIHCKMLNQNHGRVRWEFNTYEPGIQHLESTGDLAGTAYLTMVPKSNFDFGSLRCYHYNQTASSCPCEYKIIQELESVEENALSFFSPTQEYINVIAGNTLDENITCNINIRGRDNKISWWKIEEHKIKCDGWDRGCTEGEIKEIKVNTYKLTIGREGLNSLNYYNYNSHLVAEYTEEADGTAEYKLFMPFSTYVNYSTVWNNGEGVYQCRVWNPTTDVTIIQNITLNVKVPCSTLHCSTDNSHCIEGIGDSDAECKCKEGYAEYLWHGLRCRETCAVKSCPELSQCNDEGGRYDARCECDEGYYLSNDVCVETCYLNGCGKFKKCEGSGIGYCTCDDGYSFHVNKCIDQNIVNITKGALMSYNRLMLNSVSFVDEMYQRILKDRLDIKNIYKIILSNYIPDYENQELLCFLNKTSNDGLAQNITSWLAPVKLMSRALYTGKHALQKLFLNGSIPDSCNDVYTEIVKKSCGRNTCYKAFGPCLSFLDDSVEQWNSLMDELNMIIKNWKYDIIKDSQLKEINIESLMGNSTLKEMHNKVQECAPTKDLTSADVRIKLRQYRLNLEFGIFEQYAMTHLEERVNSLKNINKKILEKVCGGFSNHTEDCNDRDINMDISSNKPTPSPDVSKMLSGMAEKLKSYNEDNSVNNYFNITDECESFEVKCPDGMCISSTFKCDGVNHCSNGLDESDQYCERPSQFQCKEARTVNKDKICDGQWDCADGSDETLEICENFCPTPYFRIGGECFLAQGRNSQHEAKKHCEAIGLKLAQLHTNNNVLLEKKLPRLSFRFWVDSYFHHTKGFTWSNTGLRIDGLSDAYKKPYQNCLRLFTLNKPPRIFGYENCYSEEPALCEKENFDVAETVPLSHFGAPDGFEWIGEHLVLVHGRGTVDSDTRMTYKESLEWCQQENFKPFVPANTKQWEDMRWLLKKYQHDLEWPIRLPAFDEHINNNFTWYNGEEVSDEWRDYWRNANAPDWTSTPKDPYHRYSFENSSQCLSVSRYSVSVEDCNRKIVPMICEYTGDLLEAKVPVHNKKEMECGEILNNITRQEMYEIDFLKIRGNEGATSFNREHTPHDGFGYHVLTYQFWRSKKIVDLLSQPEALWYQFPAPITVIKFAFQPCRDRRDGQVQHAPSKYEFFGTNSKDCNDRSTWETLFVDNSGTPFHNKSHVKMETLDNTKKFRCYGIKVTEVPNPRIVEISAVRMWVQKDSWFQVGGETFKIVQGVGSSWYDSRGICQCLDANLARPDDPKYLYQYIGKHQIGSRTLYLAATDLLSEGHFKWLNGDSVVDIGHDLYSGRQNCLALGFKDGKYLKDVYCFGEANTLCEKNDVQNSRNKHIKNDLHNSRQKYNIFGLRGEYFVAVKESLNWEDARSYCQGLGGDLAIPKDITLLRNYLFKNELIYDYWLGAKKENQWDRNGMKWLDGEKVDFETIPSVYIGEKGHQFDFQVLKYPSISETIPSASSQYFICETDALMVEYVAVKGAPFEFEKCTRSHTFDTMSCETGKDDCFRDNERCDRDVDCKDGSDEEYCEPDDHNIYILVGSEKFLVIEDKETWSKAKRLCSFYGGYLARPKNLLKLKNFLSENYSQLSYWIGGSDLEKEGTWVWGSSQTNITTGWADDEPGSILYDQDCLVFNTALNHDKSLSASQCKIKKAFVCQYSEQN